MTPVGFPHSETRGSKGVCPSPRIIAACHVLRRLPVPRHPPCALDIFSTSPLARGVDARHTVPYYCDREDPCLWVSAPGRERTRRIIHSLCRQTLCNCQGAHPRPRTVAGPGKKEPWEPDAVTRCVRREVSSEWTGCRERDAPVHICVSLKTLLVSRDAGAWLDRAFDTWVSP